MGRTKGSKNLAVKVPDPLLLSDEEKIALIADLLVELTIDELSKLKDKKP
ncbi:MAG: hypothetical protein ACI9T8_000079 [Candidatus Saccharimonadales bacterium]|jgi:hypothetical protein